VANDHFSALMINAPHDSPGTMNYDDIYVWFTSMTVTHAMRWTSFVAHAQLLTLCRPQAALADGDNVVYSGHNRRQSEQVTSNP
jgi:hypothetical protein